MRYSCMQLCSLCHDTLTSYRILYDKLQDAGCSMASCRLRDVTLQDVGCGLAHCRMLDDALQDVG